MSPTFIRSISLLKLGREVVEVQRTDQPGVGARRRVGQIRRQLFEALAGQRALRGSASAFSRASSSRPTFSVAPSPGTLHEDLAQRDRLRRRELALVRVVVPPRFLVRHRDLARALRSAAPATRSSGCSMFRRRSASVMFSCLSAAWNCSSLSILLSFLMLSRIALELLVGQPVAELVAALHDQHLVDDVDDQLRRDLVEHPAELRVRWVGRRIDLLAHLPERRDLARLRARSW